MTMTVTGNMLDAGAIDDRLKQCESAAEMAACVEEIVSAPAKRNPDESVSGSAMRISRVCEEVRAGIDGHEVIRNRGAFFTPEYMVDRMIDRLAEGIEAQREVSIIDPACGTGNFLIRLAERLPHRFMQLRGIEIDPISAQIARLLLWLVLQPRGASLEEVSGWIRTGDALEGEDGAGGDGPFDLVIGNPPFIDAARMMRTMPGAREVMAQAYVSAKGNWDLATVFVERGLQLLKPGGRLCFVLPRRILGSDHASAIQRMLLDQSTIEYIGLADSPFEFHEAAVETVIVQVCKQIASEDDSFLVDDGKRTRQVPQGRLERTPPGYWIGAIVNEGGDAGVHPASRANRPSICIPEEGNEAPAGYVAIRSIVRCSDAATVGEAYRIGEVVCERRDEPAGLPLVTTGCIDPYRCLWGHRKTRYLKRDYVEPVVPEEWLREELPRRYAQARAPKIIMAGLSTRVEALVDVTGELLASKSTVIMIPIGCKVKVLHALCAILNSEAFTGMYRRFFGSRGYGQGTLQVGPRQVERFAVREDLIFGQEARGGF